MRAYITTSDILHDRLHFPSLELTLTKPYMSTARITQRDRDLQAKSSDVILRNVADPKVKGFVATLCTRFCSTAALRFNQVDLANERKKASFNTMDLSVYVVAECNSFVTGTAESFSGCRRFLYGSEEAVKHRRFLVDLVKVSAVSLCMHVIKTIDVHLTRLQ